MLLLCCACSAVAVQDAAPAASMAEPLAETTPSAYTDVPKDAWYADAANWGLENGVFDTGIFAPDMTMYRPMVAEAMYRAAGSPAVEDGVTYPDIPEGQYTAPAAWAAEQGLMSGYANGAFGLNDPVTREQMAAILWRYAGSPAAEAGEDFADEANIANFAKTAVDWARASGVINGKPGNQFDPKGLLTRAQAAAILYRYLTASESVALSESDSTVYMTTDISPEGMMAIYEALNWTPGENVAVRLSTGEPPASNYLRPELIKDVVQAVEGTIVECNTAYSGSRASTAMHYQVAEDHGFTAIADVVILDENGSMTLPVTGGTVLTENYVGAYFTDYDSYLVLSHFKGHAMAGFGGERTKTSRSALAPVKANAGFTPAEPAAPAPGAATRPLSQNPWLRPESLWWTLWMEKSSISTL